MGSLRISLRWSLLFALTWCAILGALPGRSAEVETVRRLWNFDNKEDWQVWWPGEQGPAPFVPGSPPTGYGIRMTPVYRDVVLPVYASEFKVGNPVAPSARITLTVEVQTGKGAFVALSLMDTRKEGFRYAERALSPGMNEVTWSVQEEITGTWGERNDPKPVVPLHLWELGLRRTPGDGDVYVRFVSADVRETMPALSAVRVDVETGNPAHVIREGEENRVALRVENIATVPLTVGVELKLVSPAGSEYPMRKTLRPAPGSATLWRLPVFPKKNGVWALECTLSAEDGTTEIRRMTMCRMRPAGPTPGTSTGFLFGISSHTEGAAPPDAEHEIKAAALCGAKVLRAGPGWPWIEPAEGTWKWGTMDRLVELCRKDSLEIQYLLGYCAKWAAPPVKQAGADYREWLFAPPERMDAWRTYVRETANRYQKDIRFYEVWNEADLDLFWKGSAGRYLELLKAANEEIKGVSRDLQVLTCGFATLGDHPAHAEKDFEATVARDGADFFDILAHHEHGLFPGYQKVMDGPLAGLVKQLRPGRRFWLNETAVSAVEGGDVAQARTLVKKLCLAMARGSMGYTWYDLRNDGNDPENPEHNFGLLTRDFHPKPAYSAFNTMALLLAGKRFIRSIDLGPGRWGLVFSGEATHAVVAWRESVTVPEAVFALRMAAANSAIAYDIWGNPEKVSVVSDRIPLTVTSDPSLLVLEGNESGPRLESSLVAPEGVILVVPGGQAVYRATLYNPFEMPREFVLKWHPPSEVNGGKEVTGRCFVEPGARLTRSVETKVPAGVFSARGRAFECGLDYGADGLPWKGRITVPLFVAVPIPGASGAGVRPASLAGSYRPPDFALKDRASYVGLLMARVDPKGSSWNGPDDLSAVVWLGRRSDVLTLKVVVTDDVFDPRGREANVWQGDGVQVALAIPGQVGHWELGLTRSADAGKPAVYSYLVPEGFKDPTAAVFLRTDRKDEQTVYEAVLPYSAFGLTDAVLEQGIRFNLVVNDSDGSERKGWMQVAPGIGESKDSSAFPWIVFERPSGKKSVQR
jgi:hypothetical protein